MDKKKAQIVIIAIVMGLVALGLINRYTEQRITTAVEDIARRQIQAASQQEEMDVVVATREITSGNKIEKNMVSLRKFPKNFLQPGAITDTGAVLGKTAKTDILPGEQVTASKLGMPSAADHAGGSISMRVPTGKRAITVPIDTLSAAGGMVRPGDFVDIIGNFPVPQQIEGKIVPQLATVTLFQNVLVLSIGGQTGATAAAPGQAAPAPSAQAAAQGIQLITFAMAPKDAELLLFAREQGNLKLVIRSSLDTATGPLPVATWDALLQHILAVQGQVVVPPDKDMTMQQQALEQRVLEIYRAGILDKGTKETQPAK
ncbi:MAG: Flp pilus assembly protein CpaB [Candidatus Omnitrophota bacterium]